MLIVVVSLCWVLRDEDRSRRLVQIINAWRVGRAARAAAKNAGAAAQPRQRPRLRRRDSRAAGPWSG